MKGHEKIAIKRVPKRKRFYLGEKYPGIYFSKQEAHCMKYFLEGLSHRNVGEILRLSPRTTMFYSQNMRMKLDCANKKELIEKVKNSDFLLYIEELA